MSGRNLPSAYQRVEYIKSTGRQYIDTAMDVDTSCKFVFDVAYDAFYGDDYDWFLGNRQAATNWLAGVFRNAACFWSGLTGYIYAGNLPVGTRITLTVDFASGTFSTSAGNSAKIPLDSPSPYPVRLFIGNLSSFRKSPLCRCFGVRLFKAGTLIADFISCLRTADDTAGLFDLVGQRFCPSAGSEPFAAGPLAPSYVPVVISAQLSPRPAQAGQGVLISVAAIDVACVPSTQVVTAGEFTAGEV